MGFDSNSDSVRKNLEKEGDIGSIGRRKNSNMKNLLIFGLGVFVTFGFIVGFFNGLTAQSTETGELFGIMGLAILLLSAPIIVLAISIVQGIAACNRKEAIISGAITGGVGYFLFWLVILFSISVIIPSSGGSGSSELEDLTVFILSAISCGLIGSIGAFLSTRLNKGGFSDMNRLKQPPQNRREAMPSQQQNNFQQNQRRDLRRCPQCGEMALSVAYDGSANCKNCNYSSQNEGKGKKEKPTDNPSPPPKPPKKD